MIFFHRVVLFLINFKQIKLMKKLLLSLGLVCIGALAHSQILLSENFEGTTFPPTGWSRANTNASRPWDFTTVNFNAAGQADYTISGAKICVY